MTDEEMKQRVVFITGGNSGIGLETALLFAEICERVNLPAGVVNIITGDGETGSALVKHEMVNKIALAAP